jgi:hypothetical protein
MKKLILFLMASFLLVQVADAQLFNWGIKGGLGFSSIKISDVTGIQDGSDVYDLVTGESVMGYHLGLQTRIKIAMIYVQPELYWNAGGGSVKQVVDGGASELLEVKFNRIDIPVLVGAKLGPVRLNIGPMASLVVGENSDFQVLQADASLYKENFTWAWQGGIGVDISKFSLDIRYEGPLSDLSRVIPDDLSEYTLDPRPQQWIFSVGWWFGKK